MRHPVAQVGLVHGGGIEPVPFADGAYRLQPGSEARATRGIELVMSGTVERLIFSGGNAHGYDLPATEAELMADLAMRAGLNAGQIDVEPESSSTIGNWANSLQIIGGNGFESVLGITGRVARPRAQGIGMSMIHHYGLDVELAGYRTTREPVSPKVLAREATASTLAAAWLGVAWRKGRTIGELDAAYRDRRVASKVAGVKEHFTHR